MILELNFIFIASQVASLVLRVGASCATGVAGFSWKQLARITFPRAVTLAFTTDFWQGEGPSYILQPGKMLTWLIPILLWLCKLAAKWLQFRRAALYTACALRGVLKRFSSHGRLLLSGIGRQVLLDLWFNVYIFMRSVSNRCSFGKINLLTVLGFFCLFSLARVLVIRPLLPHQNYCLAALWYCVLY